MGRNSRKRPIPEYLKAEEIKALLDAAPNPRARRLMLMQWRAGLRISEALEVRPADVRRDPEHPVLRVRRGKGDVPRLVPLHPELANVLGVLIDYGSLKQGETFAEGASRSTASRWVEQAVRRVVEAGALAPDRKVSSHTLRHSYARYMVEKHTPVNLLSLWLGHSTIQTTLDYIKLLPDPDGIVQTMP